jgi:hypothetical protein
MVLEGDVTPVKRLPKAVRSWGYDLAKARAQENTMGRFCED